MKKYIDLINKNFSLLVAIPPLLGSIWQLLKLSSISISYIRFFSLSQLIPDGIIISIFIFILIVGIILIVYLYKKFEIRNGGLIEEKAESSVFMNKFIEVKKGNWIIAVLLYIVSLFLFIMIEKINFFMYENLQTFYFLLLVLPTNLLMIILFPFIYFKAHNHMLLLDKSFANKMGLLAIAFLVIGYYNLLFFYYSEFNRKILFPNNLVNQSKIENTIKTEFPYANVKLLYNNDKYLFYSIIDKKMKTEKIKIVSFDKLFEN